MYAYEDLYRCVFSPTLIIHWEGLGYLYSFKESKITIQLALLDEVLDCYKWYQSKYSL